MVLKKTLNSKTEDSSQKSTTQEISKMTVNEEELTTKTIPNPVVLGGPEQIALTRIQPIEIPSLLFMHPALPRGIEIKANRMVSRVDVDLERNIIKNPSKHKLVKKARDYCKRILHDSGGPLFIKDMAKGAFSFGTSFAVLQTNRLENEVLLFEHQHEIFFGAARYPKGLNDKGWDEVPMDDRRALFGKLKIDPKLKEIDKFTQLTKKSPSETTDKTLDNFQQDCQVFVDTRTHPELKGRAVGNLVPVGDEIPRNLVMKLLFDRLGDEVLGIPLAQVLRLTIIYLIDMERAGAQTQVNFGFNKWVANTPFKDKKKMLAFGRSLSNLQKDSVVILPKDIEIKNVEPGTTEFDKIHPIYLQLIAMRLGIPMPLLVQDGTSTNKATLDSQKEDMYDDFVADELTFERVMNDTFFKAVKIKWPDLKVEELNDITPLFKFNKPPEDIDKDMERSLKFSLMIRNYATAAKDFAEATGDDKEVISSIGLQIRQLINEHLPKSLKVEEEEIKKITLKPRTDDASVVKKDATDNPAEVES